MLRFPLVYASPLSILLAIAACSGGSDPAASAGPGDGAEGGVVDPNADGDDDASADARPPRKACASFGAATDWSLPDLRFYKPFQEANPANWTTFDIDGDGKIDLVRTADPNKTSQAFGTAGAAFWEVYKNTGSGFASAPTSWPVPDVLFYKPFQEANPANWTTFDIDGDGKLDLVRTAD